MDLSHTLAYDGIAGLGSEFVGGEHWTLPNPDGLDGIQGAVPALPTRHAVSRASIRPRKFGPSGTYHPSTAWPWTAAMSKQMRWWPNELGAVVRSCARRDGFSNTQRRLLDFHSA